MIALIRVLTMIKRIHGKELLGPGILGLSPLLLLRRELTRRFIRCHLVSLDVCVLVLSFTDYRM
jgi:hypothetical protein